MSYLHIKGLDVSDYQRGLSVKDLKSKGIDFIILKLGYGTRIVDNCFAQFYNEAVSAGIPVGAYFYSLATTEEEAIRDAKKALSIVGGRKLPLGIYMDVEEKSQLALRDSVLTSVVKAFCDTVRAAGYIPGAYGSQGNLWAKVGPSYLGDDVIVWVAKWATNPPTFGDIWQYTESEKVSGYNGNIDGDKALSERFVKMMNAPVPTPQPTPTPTPEPSGKSCEVTLKLPVLQYNPAIKSTYVQLVQTILIAKNYACGGPGADGYFGNGTLQAVKNFQEENGLTQDGIVGPSFWIKLLSI